MYRVSRYFFVCIIMVFSLMVSGCLSDVSYAPVSNAWTSPKAKGSTYTVKKGDTLYSIAWGFGLDYRALAVANNLSSPYAIRPGEKLIMTTVAHGAYSLSPPKVTTTKPAVASSPSKAVILQPVTSQRRVVKLYRPIKAVKRKPALKVWPAPKWRKPAWGRVVQGFSNTLAGNKGINIAGRLGEPIWASSGGIVVYSGDGVRGYGNLVIIKHNNSYLSAYAYNQRSLVRVGQSVVPGQRIALMGRNTSGRAMLHFEIRKNGRPVNPMRYLR